MLALIEQIYACADDPSRWEGTLESIAHMTGADSLALFARLPDTVVLAKTGIRDDAWQEFVEYYAGINPIAPRCDVAFGADTIRDARLVITEKELEATEFYNDFFKPNAMHHVVGVSVKVGEGMPLADFSSQRSKQRGAFSDNTVAQWEVLTPHLRRALSISRTMKSLRDTVGGLDTALSCYDHVIFAVGPTGNVVFQSAAAETMLQEGSALRVVAGKLHLDTTEANDRLQHLIHGVAELGLVDGRAAGGAMQVPRQGKQPLDVVVSPLRSDDLLGYRKIAAVVTVNDVHRMPATRTHLMRSLFRLSPVELRVADMLLAGMETREVAEHMGISFETVRFHVKRVLAKTGSKRQTELVRRMMSLPGLPG
jgi:DNA-binding CsgD family transcriptional regulator